MRPVDLRDTLRDTQQIDPLTLRRMVRRTAPPRRTQWRLVGTVIAVSTVPAIATLVAVWMAVHL